MILIIDANIIFSGLIKEGISRELLIDCPFDLYSPETVISEIRKHKNLILEKSGLSSEEFEVLFALLTEKINIVNKEKYEKYFDEANKIIGNVDKNDIPFLALALSFPNDGIWSEDKGFKNQDRIKVYTTEELIKIT